MRSPPGVFLDLGKPRSGEGKGDGGPAHGGAAPFSDLGSERTEGSRQPAQKEEKRALMLT
jgi:hypothetical protein